MSILQLIAGKKLASTDSINEKLDSYQNILENQGYKVKRCKHMTNYEAAIILTAQKGNITIRTSRYLRGGEDVALILQHGNYETTIPLFPYNFKEALDIADTLQYHR
jgi:diphthamide synthase subunit DPH2